MTGPGLKKNKSIFQNMLLVLGWLGLDRSRRLFIAALCSSHPYIQQCTQVTQHCSQIIHIYTVHSSYYTANGHCSQCSTLSDTGCTALAFVDWYNHRCTLVTALKMNIGLAPGGALIALPSSHPFTSLHSSKCFKSFFAHTSDAGLVWSWYICCFNPIQCAICTASP